MFIKPKRTKTYNNRSISSPEVSSLYYEPSSVAICHRSAMYVVMIRSKRSYFKEQWVAVVAEVDLANHGRTTSRNGHGQASRCRHCGTSRVTEADCQSSQRMHLSECPNDARASRALLVSLFVSVSLDTTNW